MKRESDIRVSQEGQLLVIDQKIWLPETGSNRRPND
jgi:hypothetical protein